MSSPQARAQISLLDVVVFADELALLAVLAVAGAGLGEGVAARTTSAVALPALTAVAWGRWLAPRAPRRLPPPAALITKLGLFVVAAALLAITRSVPWALVFGFGSIAILASAHISAHRRAPAP